MVTVRFIDRSFLVVGFLSQCVLLAFVFASGAEASSAVKIPRSLELHLQSFQARQEQPSPQPSSQPQPQSQPGAQNVTASAANKTLSGITPLSFSSDRSSYYSLIKLGAIYFRVALDTASADLWVLSTACGTGSCRSAPRYPLAYQSPTFGSVNANGTVFNASYADTTAVSGFVARETLQLANLTVKNQAFAIITNSNVTLNDQMSGILGLGFPRLSTINSLASNATPFFVSLAQQGLLDYPLFGLSLTRSNNGSLAIGAIDSSVVKNVSAIGWNEVVPFSPFKAERNTSSYLQWAIPLAKFSANGTELDPLPTYPEDTNKQSLALIDVGSVGIYGPYPDVSRLYDGLPGSRLVDTKGGGQWAVPCDTTSTIRFKFGETNYTLLPTDYIIGPASGNPNLCLTWPRALPLGNDGIDWQFGQAFLRTVYSIFSYGINSKESPMIGLYPLYKPNQPVPSSSAVASFLSSASATVATTFPNSALSTPTQFSTPPYAFNTSVPARMDGIATSELATSTYEPVIQRVEANATTLPAVTPIPTLVTFILTDVSGAVVTSTSTVAMPSITLGQPPGWSSAGCQLIVPRLMLGVGLFLVFSFGI